MSDITKKTPLDPCASEIVDFWIAAGPEKWFEKIDEFDREIASRFGALMASAKAGELEAWREDAIGVLALILLLDQFPRNVYRDSPEAFACDADGVAVADAAIAAGYDAQFEIPVRRFFFTPFMHVEDMVLQKRCIALCRALDDEEGVKFAMIHAEIIEKFGRFPHRNAGLGRVTTEEEKIFLTAGGFSG